MQETFLQAVREVLGEPLPGFEFVEYVACFIFLMFLVSAVISLIGSVLKWIGGGF